MNATPANAKAVSPVVEAVIEATKASPMALFSIVQIPDKAGRPLWFAPAMHKSQRTVLDLLTGPDDRPLAVLKSRQVGMSTLAAAWLFWRWWSSPGETHHAFTIHVQAKGRKFSRLWASMYASLPPEVQAARPARVLSDSLTLEDTGATLMIATAKSSGGARSATLSSVVCSEYPFWKPDRAGCEDILSTIQGSLAPGGRLLVESTAAYHGDALHGIMRQAESEAARWRFHFDSWLTHPEYRADPGPNADTDNSGEAEHDPDPRLTPEQAAWFAQRVAEMGEFKARREYPIEPDDAFGNVEDAFFAPHDLQHVKVVGPGPEINEWLAPTGAGQGPWVAGSDVAFGVGLDYSTLVIVDRTSMQPVYRLRDNRCRPEEWSRKIQMVLAGYTDKRTGRMPLLLVESNGPGQATLATLKAPPISYPNLWADPDKPGSRDWVTDTKSKLSMFTRIKELVARATVTDLDPILDHDLRSLRADPHTGSVLTPHNEYGHCDVAIAAALAYTAIETYPDTGKPPVYDPFRRPGRR